MLIEGNDFFAIDTREKITIADSFVVGPNKLGTGNGEAKLYVGNEGPEIRKFFGNEGFEAKCFFLKSDLIKFLEELKYEYKNPVLPYRKKNNLPRLYDERLADVIALPDIIPFTISDQDQIEPPRIYVSSNDSPYQLLRKLPLPNLSYLSIMKMTSKDGEIKFYCRLFSDFIYSFGTISHPAEEDEVENEISADDNLSDEEKYQTKRARVGQGKYRKNLLEECQFCPFTLVGDDRLLIASHIKPWVKSDPREQIDPKNGFMFTPTFDYLFDQGFITFANDKRVIVSPWLSTPTIQRLCIIPNKIIKYLPIDGREVYMDYHRKIIFKS